MFISLYFSTICLLKVDPVFQQLIGPLTISRNPECCFPFLSLNCDIKCKRCLKIKILHLMLWYGTGNISVIKVCLKKHINFLNFNFCRDNMWLPMPSHQCKRYCIYMNACVLISLIGVIFYSLYPSTSHSIAHTKNLGLNYYIINIFICWLAHSILSRELFKVVENQQRIGLRNE